MTDPAGHQTIAQASHQLIQQVRRCLNGNGLPDDWGNIGGQSSFKGSAVLFLLTMHQTLPGGPMEPCLLLNKRSQKVLQPGDLCCPGGGVERLDRWIAPFMHWPLMPLGRWPHWHHWRKNHPGKSKGLALLLTTALREALEEMRLNPLRVNFLGPLPVQKLIMYERTIYPLAGWVAPHQHLKPNWEVERIVYLPLTRLLAPANYARMQLSFKKGANLIKRQNDFACYIHKDRHGQEIFWGATFRIAMDFLKQVFKFQLPDLTDAPIYERRLGPAYLNGSIVGREGQSQVEDEQDY